MHTIIFTKQHKINKNTYGDGDMLKVSTSIKDSLVEKGVAKIHKELKKKS